MMLLSPPSNPGEPIFTCVRPLAPGDRLVASYRHLRQELRLPAVHLLRTALYHQVLLSAGITQH